MIEPRYIALVVITLDGKIASREKEFTDWTSKEDKIFLRGFLDTCDLVIVGRNTYEAAQKPLSKRNCLVFTGSVDSFVKEKDNLVHFNPQKSDIREFVKEHGYQKIAVLGGTQTFTYFLENGLLDEIYLTIEPVIFGGGLPLFDGKFMLRRARVISIKKLNKEGVLLIQAALK